MANARVPNVVKYGFYDFKESEKADKGVLKKKWHAKCNICKVEISESRGTTSSFTR